MQWKHNYRKTKPTKSILSDKNKHNTKCEAIVNIGNNADWTYKDYWQQKSTHKQKKRS